jgi:serine/threonine protein kinase
MSRGKHLIGKVLGSCVLEQLLGYGGSSAVLLAQQHNPERKVAVKAFLPHADMDKKMQSDFYRRFLHEAEAASKLDHPNILPIYSYGEQDGLPYIVMPYMRDGTLSEYISKHSPVSLPEAQWFLEQISSALDYAHTHGCVHCDVKPANILLDSDGRVMLSDFGIARVIATDDGAARTATRTSEALMGTPDYISPEQALGQSIDGRSDVYSLGITLFYLLAKRLPFIADSTLTLALLHVHEPPPSLALIRADISPGLDRVVRKALAKEPDKRFQTATEFCAAFAQAVMSSDKMLSVASGERRGAILAANTDLIPGESQPVIVALDPLVRVKPMGSSNFVSRRLIVAAALILCLLFATSYVTNLVSRQQVHSAGSNGVHSITATPDPTHIDQLTLHGKWPGSRTFFYDSQKQYYHILNNSPQDVALALYNGDQFSKFRLTVTMSEIRATTERANYYGVVFRSAVDQSHYYLFEVVTKDRGQYAFLRFDDGQWTSLASGPAPQLLSGPGQSNTITINAIDNTFTFSINEKPVDGKPATDPTKSLLQSGLIGLYVEEQGSEVAFSHLYIVPRQ